MKFDLNCFIATVLFKLGFKYKTSTGIHGGLTWGYGDLDSNGFWQFPLYFPKYIKRS